jgi:uncharacterized membrane protein (DUF373 family)
MARKKTKVEAVAKNYTRRDRYLRLTSRIVAGISVVLSVVMIGVIIFLTLDLIRFIASDLIDPPLLSFGTGVFEIFGLFLNVMIAIELLDNITSYLKHHHVQLELVILTSLTAVARKIIMLDLKKTDGVELIGLSLAVGALSASYIGIRHFHSRNGR